VNDRDRAVPFSADTVGMCPATLLPEPMSCDVAGLREIARASAGAGFPTLSLWSFYATGNGVDTTRKVFDDAGITVRAVEAATSWTEGPEPAVADADQQLDVAAAFGADVLLACTLAPTMDAVRATEGFAALCERASAHGVRVAVEFLPWSAVPDLATTWRLLQESGATNGGIVIDMMHWQRQPGGPNLELLREIPGERVHYVQVCDAAPEPSGTDYMTEALTARAVPGEGCVDIETLLGTLAAIDAHPYFALEVFNAELAARGASAMAAELRRAARTVFG
jgi:sugar phosphate isomerase/epimerase